jgi:hypothetical protein
VKVFGSAWEALGGADESKGSAGIASENYQKLRYRNKKFTPR